MPTCPNCTSLYHVKNGHIHNGKQRFLCKECRYQYIENPEKKVISAETKSIIDGLLAERISLAGIARATKVSETWLYQYIAAKYQATPRCITLPEDAKKRGKLSIQCDEMWSFVGSKADKQWIWLAIDNASGYIVGCHVGGRDKEGAQGLWDALPPVYRQCAVAYTDLLASYGAVFPQKRHKPVDKKSGKTYKIERFNNTVRQRVSRLVRKALSFSKNLENHISAIWYFIHHYNLSLLI